MGMPKTAVSELVVTDVSLSPLEDLEAAVFPVPEAGGRQKSSDSWEVRDDPTENQL